MTGLQCGGGAWSAITPHGPCGIVGGRGKPCGTNFVLCSFWTAQGRWFSFYRITFSRKLGVSGLHQCHKTRVDSLCGLCTVRGSLCTEVFLPGVECAHAPPRPADVFGTVTDPVCMPVVPTKPRDRTVGANSLLTAKVKMVDRSMTLELLGGVR